MTNFKGPKEKNMKNGDDVKVFEGGDLDDENGMFNFDNLRLSQNFSELVGVKKALLTVPVKKPHRQEFIRVRPGSKWRLETAVLELKEEQETYLVDSKLWQNLPGEIIPKVLFTTINRQGTLTIWPVRLPGEDGRHNPWHRSAEHSNHGSVSRGICPLVHRTWEGMSGACQAKGSTKAVRR